jgi:hypothetical protein
MKNLYNALVLWALAAVGLSAQAPHSSPNTARELCNKAPVTVTNVIWLGDAQQVENQYFTIFSNPGWITDIESLTIFDRWGNAVRQRHNFAANTPTEGWDGQQNGRPVDPAVFVFIAEVSLADGTRTTLRGDVTVVR